MKRKVAISYIDWMKDFLCQNKITLTMPVIHLHDFMVHDLTLMAQILILKKQLLFI